MPPGAASRRVFPLYKDTPGTFIYPEYPAVVGVFICHPTDSVNEVRQMGQYFSYAVNATRDEYVALPGMLKAIERFTNPVPMGIMGYLLIEGPNDGTVLYRNANTDTELVREKVEEIKERERESEEEQFERYMNERPDYKVRQFKRDHDDADPDDDPEAWEAFCRDAAESAYRKRDGSGEWDTDKLIRSALANFEIRDTHDYAGRWAGDEVYITGDYSNQDYYAKCQKHTRVRLPNGEETRVQGVREKRNADGSKPYSNPINVDDIPYAEEPGDHIEVRGRDTESYDETVVGEVIEVEEPEYTDITDGVIAEFTALVGEDFMNGDEGATMRPDMVISSGN